MVSQRLARHATGEATCCLETGGRPSTLTKIDAPRIISNYLKLRTCFKSGDPKLEVFVRGLTLAGTAPMDVA